MNDSEFNEWLTGFCKAFPSVKAWLVALPGDDNTGVRLSWREVFEDVEIRDAKAVTVRMSLGDDPPPPSFDRELTAAHVRKLAAANRLRRIERDDEIKRRRNTDDARRSGPQGPGAGELYSQMLALMDANPDLSAREAAEQVMPPAAENPNGRRYDCHLCLDSGIVIVWSPVSIRAALNNELDKPGNRRVSGAPCCCRAGDPKVWRNSGDPPRGWSGWRTPDAVYATDRHCICPRGDTESPDAISAFKDWCAERLLAAQQGKRNPAFDDWNNAGGRDRAVSN